MFVRSVLILCATFMLLSHNPGMSLASPQQSVHDSQLQKRATWRWWKWSTTGGYKSGTSNSPPNMNAGNDGGDSYANIQTGAQPSSYSSSRHSSHNSDGYTPHNSGSYSPGSSPTPKGPTASVAQSDIQKWLHSHNQFRATFHAPPLKWNPTLAAASKRLVDTCVWEHTQNNPYGENMSAGQESIEEVVSGWVNGPEEKGAYSPSNTVPSHFTQVVYVSTTEVGCYKNTCSDVRGANLPQSPVTFWGCNYNPPGNVIGQIAQNVKAAAGGAPMSSGYN